MDDAAINRTSLPKQIARILRREIFTGLYAPGDLFPPERELALRFGAARGTVRKSLATLAEEGWIEITQGRGNMVRDFKKNIGFDLFPMLLAEFPEEVATPEAMDCHIELGMWIYERILVEASRKAGPEDEARLLAILDRLGDDTSLAKLQENNNRLLDELLSIGGNLLTRLMYNTADKLFSQAIDVLHLREEPFEVSGYRALHRSLVKAICAGEEERVRLFMKKSQSEAKMHFHRLIGCLVEELKNDS